MCAEPAHASVDDPAARHSVARSLLAPHSAHAPSRSLVMAHPPHPYVLSGRGQWTRVATPVTDAQMRASFLSMVKCGGQVIHVSGRGSDSADGSSGAPLRQISAAIARALPGDLILVRDGTYGYTEVRDFHGRDDAWLGIMSESASTAARIHVPGVTDNFVNIIGSDHVGIYGFEVFGDQHNANTNGSGISIYGNSHHVAVWNNHIHDFPGGGVNCFDVDGSHDLLDISYNRIHGTSRYSPSNTSGISICASRDLTRGGAFPDGYGYRVVGNFIYDVQCLVPFTPGGFHVVTDGNGVSLDQVTTAYGYRKPILVAGNVVAGCGGRGVLAYESSNVRMIDNTAVGNLKTRSPAIDGGVELESKSARSVIIERNIICPLHTADSTDHNSSYFDNIILGGTQDVPAGNHDRRRVGLSYFSGIPNASALAALPPLAAFWPR